MRIKSHDLLTFIIFYIIVSLGVTIILAAKLDTTIIKPNTYTTIKNSDGVNIIPYEKAVYIRPVKKEIIQYLALEEVPGRRYGFTEDDIILLTQLLCGDKDKDGDGEYDFTWDLKNGQQVNYEQISLVLCVVMNRIRDDRFPDTVREVVLQKRQFSCFPRNLKSDPDTESLDIVRDWCEAYDMWEESVQTIPEDHLYFTGDGTINKSRINWR